MLDGLQSVQPPYGMIMAQTFPQLLFEKAYQYGDDKIALRQKDYGIWQGVTWGNYLEQVKHLCLGLVQLGLTAKDTVAIIGDNRPEWLYAELATQAAGAKCVGIYQDAIVSEMIDIIRHADVKFIIVEDQEQVDKIIEIWADLNTVSHVIYYEPKGLSHYHHPNLLFLPEVQDLGRQFERQQPHWFESQIAQGKSSDIALLSTTAGTTGSPKLTMLTYHNLLSMGRNLMRVDPIEPTDEFMSFLPLAWIGEQVMTLACALQQGFTINFPEKPATVPDNLREIGPQVMFTPPRVWETMVSQVQVKMADSSWLKRLVYHWALPVGHEMADCRFRREQPSPSLTARYLLADWLVFRLIKDYLGLGRLRRAYTGGAAIGPDVFRFFHALGVNLKQIYGQTELCGLAVMHRDGDIKFQTVGTPIPETEVKIDARGEILIRSPAVFPAYYHNEAATRHSLQNGWLHTGDAGYFDEDGHLVIIDRVKDVMTLHDGTKFSPQFIENKLKFSPYIKEAVVFGGDWPFVTAMINIDLDNLAKWAENHQITYTTYTDLSQKPAVYDLVRRYVQTANQDLPPAARIQRFLLLHKELDADDAELTRTRKVRRNVISQRYEDLISALYSSSDYLDVQTTITYQDGRTAALRTRLRIETVN